MPVGRDDHWTSTASPDKTKVPPGCLDHLGKLHKEKWKIIYKEPYGRCVVAVEDIKAGQAILLDHPIITGPKQDCGYLCLGCYKKLPEDPDYLCSKCGWPMCCFECESNGYHPLECQAFAKAGYRFRLDEHTNNTVSYNCILPLRCLMTRDLGDKKKWNTLQAMESHDDLRRGSELWHLEQVEVCDFLREKVKITAGDALIHTITGVLDINCHEVITSSPGSRVESRARGLFPLSAMISHDCASNTHHAFVDDQLTMVLLASRDIAKGEQVTGCYTHLLSGTTERRKHLRYGKFFDCVCSRCSDPTELGTFFSALRCTRPSCDGDVICTDPLRPDNKADYACNKCAKQVPVGMVSRLTNLIYYELQNVPETDPQPLENIFRKYQPLLHKNHFHMIGIKHTLSQVYGRCSGYIIGDLTEEQLARKVECCRDLLSVLDILDPGISRLRGLTKYELHAPLLMKANKEFQQQLLTRADFLSKLQEGLSLLEETVHCLKFEPVNSNEGAVCQIARSSAQELQKWMATVKQLPESNFLPAPASQPFFQDHNLSEDDLTLEALLRKIEGY